jgi:hypothetical protein
VRPAGTPARGPDLNDARAEKECVSGAFHAAQAAFQETSRLRQAAVVAPKARKPRAFGPSLRVRLSGNRIGLTEIRSALGMQPFGRVAAAQFVSK